MPFDSWAEPIQLGNLSKKVAGNAISALISLVKSAPQVRDSKLTLHPDAVNTVTLVLFFLWFCQSDFSSFGENTGDWRSCVLERGPCPPLVSRKWIAVLAGDSWIFYHEIWTLGLMYSEACYWHLQKPWHPTLWFMIGVRQRSILNDCQPDDKASYYRAVLSPGLKTHSGGTEACRGEDKI